VLTTPYAPADYAINACGNNFCTADFLAAGQDGDGHGARAHVKGTVSG